MRRCGSSIATVALLMGLAGCRSSMTAPDPVPAAVANAPTSLALGTAPVTLSARLWRDFMPGPGASSEGSGLMVLASVTSADAVPLPADLTIGSVWVLNGGQAWNTEQVENRRDSPAVQTGIARNGPRWGPDLRVTVVVGVRVGGGPERYLRADAVPIGRTD